MADKKIGLPVRTEEDVDKKVQVKIVDSVNPDTQQMEVDTDGNAHVEMHGNDPAGLDKVLKTSEDGSMDIDGVYDVANNTEPANIGIVTQERNATASDTRQTEQVTAIRGSVDTDTVSMDVSLHDDEGNAYTDTNPVPVYNVEDPGTDVHDFKEDVDVAVDGTSTHTYLVPAGNDFLLKQVLVASSGRGFYELLVGPVASEVVKAVVFVSVAAPSFNIPLSESINVPAGQNVLVRKNNTDCDVHSMYSTIVGSIRA